MKNELWVLIPTTYYIKKESIGIGHSGWPSHFPYTKLEGWLLEGFHALTKKRMHSYGPFDTLEQIETFAQEHHIDLTTNI